MAEVNVHQWRFLGPQQRLLGGERVTLRSEVEDKSIRHGERDFGINLVWEDAADLANNQERRMVIGWHPESGLIVAGLAGVNAGNGRYPPNECCAHLKRCRFVRTRPSGPS